MSNIPIQLSPLTVPVDFQAGDINQLLTIISQYLSASISANVSFFQQGSNWPTSDQGIFFNQTTRQFGTWSTGQGRYLPVTGLIIGDTKASFVAGDNTAAGWIQLNGRAINAVTGITNEQKSALEGLFGVGANLPNYTFLSGLSGVPANNSFTDIVNPETLPTAAQVALLPVGGSYSQTEMTAVRDATAGVAGSATTLQAALAQSIGYSEKIINALNAGGVSGPQWFVYVGSQ